MGEFSGTDEGSLGEGELVRGGDGKDLEPAVELVGERVARGADAGAFVDVEQERIAFGKKPDRYIVGGSEAADVRRFENEASPFDAGGHI